MDDNFGACRRPASAPSTRRDSGGVEVLPEPSNLQMDPELKPEALRKARARAATPTRTPNLPILSTVHTPRCVRGLTLTQAQEVTITVHVNYC